MERKRSAGVTYAELLSLVVVDVSVLPPNTHGALLEGFCSNFGNAFRIHQIGVGTVLQRDGTERARVRLPAVRIQIGLIVMVHSNQYDFSAKVKVVRAAHKGGRGAH